MKSWIFHENHRFLGQKFSTSQLWAPLEGRVIFGGIKTLWISYREWERRKSLGHLKPRPKMPKKPSQAILVAESRKFLTKFQNSKESFSLLLQISLFAYLICITRLTLLILSSYWWLDLTFLRRIMVKQKKNSNTLFL